MNFPPWAVAGLRLALQQATREARRRGLPVHGASTGLTDFSADTALIGNIIGRRLDHFAVKRSHADGLIFTERGWGETGLLSELMAGMLVRRGEPRRWRVDALEPRFAQDWMALRSAAAGSRMSGERVLVRRGDFDSALVRANERDLLHVAPLLAGSRKGHVSLVAPASRVVAQTGALDPTTPVVMLFPGMGFEGFSLLTNLLAAPLAAQYGFASLVIEAPMHGRRRAPSRLQASNPVRFGAVTDFLYQACVLAAEGLGLARWLYESGGHANLALAGLSYGGALAGLVGTQIPRDVGLVCAFTAATPAEVFAVPGCSMHLVTDWRALQRARGLASQAETEVELYRMLTSIMTLDELPEPVGLRAPRVALLGALHDGFVLARSVHKLHACWRGVPCLTWLPGGHISSFMMQGEALREAVVASLRAGDTAASASGRDAYAVPQTS